ncbi:MAG: VOC family protein [Tissierellia bacterium]|nr:VOC family protein [Tissierellia bacterium]
MVGVEIDFVVKDSLKALELYESIFEVERIEVTSFPVGQNEAIFSIYGTRFHILDENPEFGLFAPTPDTTQTMWLNVLVEDIAKTHDAAIKAGCTVIQDLTKMEDFCVSNSVFKDPFGYMWMLHEIHTVVSFEDRVAMWENSDI